MCLRRFVIIDAFGAWSPGDRDYPERRIFISPGPRDLFTDGAEKEGVFVKFLKSGLWYEALRRDFETSTKLADQSDEQELAVARASGQHGG